MVGQELDNLNPQDILDAMPVKNVAARIARPQGRRVVVYVKKRKRWFMQAPMKWLLPVREEVGYELDELGMEVWEACDGQTRVEDIIETFAARRHLRFHEARVSVMEFLQQMTQRGIVAVVGNKGGTTDEDKKSRKKVK